MLISRLSVLQAISSMFLTASKIFSRIGQATMLIVSVAVIGLLTMLSALLVDRTDRGQVPLVSRHVRAGPGQAFGLRAWRGSARGSPGACQLPYPSPGIQVTTL